MHLTTKKIEAAAAKGIFLKNVFNRTTEKKLPSQESSMAQPEDAKKSDYLYSRGIGGSQLGGGAWESPWLGRPGRSKV